jgi:hypothetical protein
LGKWIHQLTRLHDAVNRSVLITHPCKSLMLEIVAKGTQIWRGAPPTERLIYVE